MSEIVDYAHYMGEGPTDDPPEPDEDDTPTKPTAQGDGDDGRDFDIPEGECPF